MPLSHKPADMKFSDEELSALTMAAAPSGKFYNFTSLKRRLFDLQFVVVAERSGLKTFKASEPCGTCCTLN